MHKRAKLMSIIIPMYKHMYITEITSHT